MYLKKFFILNTIIFGACSAFAQSVKGDLYYGQSEYFKAIPYYQKEIHSKKGSNLQDVHIKLGNSYQKLNDYANAEASFRNALHSGDSLAMEKDFYYNFAQILKANTKYSEASTYFNLYLSKSPDDAKAQKASKFCKEINYYLSKPIEYEVKNMELINTKNSEFSPFVAGNKLMFVAEHETFDIVNTEVDGGSEDGMPIIHMVVSEIEGTEVKKSKALSKNINSEYHDGPACLSADGHLLYFSRVSNIEKKGFVNQSKIYTASGGNRTWKNIKELPFNSDEYSVSHPSLSKDGKTIFFTSNMPGGFGGKDIWMSRKTDSINWGKPVNLGPDINTSGDEMFPAVKGDDKLFFSSNGLPGFGGLDIYSANKMGDSWLLGRNEGIQINSSTDDFGMAFLTDTTGYFSSNRMGGKGKDDIYSYKFTSKEVNLGGTILLSKNVKDIVPNKKVYLFDEKGVKVDSTYTNEKGHFVFKNLSSEKKYIAVVDEDEPQMVGKKKYYLAQKDTVITGATSRLPDGTFAFKNLDEKAPVYREPGGREISFAGRLLYGDDASDPIKNTNVKLVNQTGEIFGKTITDLYGNFIFKNIPSDQDYVVAIDEHDITLADGTKVTMTNKNGKQIKSIIKSKDNFVFKIQSSEKTIIHDMSAEDDMAFEGKLLVGENKQALKNKKVKIVNQNGDILGETTTDENGNFSFKNIPADQNYIVSLDEGDVSLPEGTRLTLANKNGKEIKSVIKTKDNFDFKILQSEKSIISDLNTEDDIAFGGKLLVGEDKKVLKNKKVKLMSATGEVLGETITDENGNFVFKNIPPDINYIVALDEGDASLPEGTRLTLTNKAGKEIKSVIKTKDNFDFKILQSEKAAISDMTQEEEITFAGTLMSGDKAAKAMKNVKVKILNQKGEVIGETMTNEFGAFAFKNIPGDQNFIVAIDEGDASLPEGTKITMTNKSGKEMKSMVKTKEEFNFKILNSDKALLEEMEANDASMAMGIYGYLYDQDKLPIANAHLTVKDADGTNARKIVTAPNGKFSFKNLSADKNYIFEADPSDLGFANVKSIQIADNKGRIYRTIELESGKFSFKLLEADKNAMAEYTVDDPWMKMSETRKREMRLKAEREAAEKKAAALKAKQEKELSEKLARELALLEAKKNKAETALEAKRLREEAVLEAKRLREEAAKEARRFKEEAIAAQKESERLAMEERKQHEREEIMADSLEINITIVESVYYAYGKFNITDEAKVVLDKAYDILNQNERLALEISSHTDAQSSSGFNWNLSMKRAAAVVDYLVSKGINRNRLKSQGFGETKILNRCKDGVTCSDEEHRVNRRTEFKLIKPRKR